MVSAQHKTRSIIIIAEYGTHTPQRPVQELQLLSFGRGTSSPQPTHYNTTQLSSAQFSSEKSLLKVSHVNQRSCNNDDSSPTACTTNAVCQRSVIDPPDLWAGSCGLQWHPCAAYCHGWRGCHHVLQDGAS
jgi:hypothetical protein